MRATIFWAVMGGMNLAAMVTRIGTGDALNAAVDALLGAFCVLYAAPYWYRRTARNGDA